MKNSAIDGRNEHVFLTQNAIVAADQQRNVWLIGKDLRVTRQTVQLGDNIANGMVIVEQGGKVGEPVVTTGLQSLHDGISVRVIQPDHQVLCRMPLPLMSRNLRSALY
ncbi:hypothetical protein [Vibrio proteolyticus]|uniref:Uncharacterized protein n=1 Tax=Vibrio proteolyticus NBRC 13287 TaxID=1219065 RepID=U3A3L9_VIBPR|nr:hypothetical protein [Vibrio proteolyticus]GAD68290.1 hypothetical protein VPR01S_12_00990 [Vibrio proteolyticus NBRC 13287]